MQENYKTQRLLLSELNLSDAEFILELVNTPGWIKFIGDRNVRSGEDAKAYIQKIIDNPAVNYWVVKTQEQQLPIGIITFIKRDYLEHYDIGFAFLERFAKQGFAYEATVAVLNDAISNPAHTRILATTVKENANSIQLLEKLGLCYDAEIQRDGETLLVYAAAADKIAIDNLVKSFFGIFTNANQQQPDLSLIHTLCIPESIIIKKTGTEEAVYNLASFIEPRKKILTDGTLTAFEETETNEETKITSNIAQRFSTYQKKGSLNGKYFHEHGTKFFQFIKTKNGWKINAVIWEDGKI